MMQTDQVPSLSHISPVQLWRKFLTVVVQVKFVSSTQSSTNRCENDVYFVHIIVYRVHNVITDILVGIADGQQHLGSGSKRGLDIDHQDKGKGKKSKKEGNGGMDVGKDSLLCKLHNIDGAAIHAGGLSEASKEALRSFNVPESARPAPRSAEDFVVDPSTCDRPIRTRNPDLASIFKNSSELEFYQHTTTHRCSLFESNQLLKMITKVSTVCTVCTVCTCAH